MAGRGDVAVATWTCQETFPLASYYLGSDRSTCSALATASLLPHPMEPGRAGQRDKAPSLQPVPRDGLPTAFTSAKQPLWSARNNLPLPLMQNPRAWGHYVPDGMEEPCRCQAGPDCSHLHSSQGARGGSLPYGLADKQVWLARGGQWLGDATPEGCHHHLIHGLLWEEGGRLPHGYTMGLAQLSKRVTSVFLSHLGLSWLWSRALPCPFQLMMIVTWVSRKTN